MWDLLESNGAVCIDPGGVIRTGPRPRALLPGSFHPLHWGHTELAAVAAARLGGPVHFELSITNVDKPELALVEVHQRIAQFAAVGPVWLTRAATFERKAELFPDTVFVLGWDTAMRVIDSRYYDGAAGRDSALRKLINAGCRFLVGGRMDEGGVFRVWDSGGLAEELAELFISLREADFRVDVSSRALRLKA